MQTLGLAMLLLALVLAIAGVLFLIGGRLGLGSLPGDLKLSGEGWGCFIPITTSIVVSIVLTLLLNLVIRWFR